jgi:type IV secretory pathway VirB2 component (pilin)
MKSIIKIFVISLLILPIYSFADIASFKPLVGIPGLENPASDLAKYINILYLLSISLAAMIAVIKIIIAGVRYMFSDLVDSKKTAKKDIVSALFGLIIVMSAVLILEYINPNLIDIKLLVPPTSS